MKADDVDALIDDHNIQKTKVQKKIEEFFFTNHDFSRDTYGDLTRFQRQSVSEALQAKFSALVDKREDSILTVLDGFDDINSVSSYYKNHSDEQPFLKPIVIGTIMQDIEDKDYYDARVLYRAFEATDIRDTIYTFYAEKRVLALPQVKVALENYCKSELKLIDVYKKEGRKRIPQVSSTAFDRLIDQLLDEDIPNNPVEIKKTFSRISSKHNPITPIKEIIKDETSGLVKDINECRADLANELLYRPILNRYRLPTIQISVKKKDVKCPVNDFVKIASVYSKPAPNSKVGALLSLASWLPGYVGMAATALDIYKAYKDTKNKANEASPYIKKMATDVFNNLTATCYKEYDESFSDIRKTIVQSQEQLKQAIYEDF